MFIVPLAGVSGIRLLVSRRSPNGGAALVPGWQIPSGNTDSAGMRSSVVSVGSSAGAARRLRTAAARRRDATR